MSFIKKLSDGKYYICRRHGKKARGAIKGNNFLGWFRSYATNKHSQEIALIKVTVPKALHGKRLQFKVEIVEKK